ncbi:Xylose import ATP-binding protein XylG [Moorella thermoacetica]|uniref:Xylose import ATP-binding protein XylG n=1 Tax=Neomoorella thermoacetica TaxID=1525 RepID=A0AAC9MUG2_NEOTH|nr:sugar ABC transporter ATP-binding protein [Moorella thermoacetica]AOQ23491.1 Xylose import ATP-binding protein XylG [Moorella thermoacetica]TYL13676.1 Xylose import ATP-binding protein XylG [Moorella thermoacetica]
MASTALLSMKDITKKFFGVTALNNVSLELRRGEILGLVGENGAGKSTLMKILSGAYPAGSYTGEIYVDGQFKAFQSKHQSEEAGIEMIYQEISLNLDLTVAENIFLGRLPTKNRFWVDWKRVYSEARAALEMVGLQIDPRKTIRSLSTSQQQLVAIAKALVRKPKILVLDEPTSALTEAEVKNLLDLLLKFKTQGVSCIYISHKLDEVFTIADRITVLRDGQTIATYERRAVSPERVVEDMVGRKISNMYPKVEVTPGPEVLRVEHLTVPHPLAARKNIIEDVSFSVRKGEVLGLAGLVGSGRSELVNAIFGALPTRGEPEIYLEGRPVQIKNPFQAIQLGLGLVTEDRRCSGFVGTMNIRQNISLASLGKIARRGFIIPNKEIKEVSRLVRQLQIKAPSAEKSVLALSGGNQQKVVLAKWLMREVKVLVLDEPTRGIDVGAKVEIYNLINQLAQNGVAIIMISSELPELLSMCDRFLVLARGKIQDEFNRAEASQERVMRAATGLLA